MKSRRKISERRLEVEPLSIVGIGASAGGLEAVMDLLNRLRPDLGMAYVVIQHLAPDHPSSLPEIFQRATSMPVLPAADGARVEPDHVYVISPDVSLTIRDGRLKAQPRLPGRQVLPIDDFLRSLAQDQERRAIAVILSGSAHDGSLGVKAVKENGGLVFAQDPASATHRSMPQSAAETGAVDFVLPPGEIAAELARVSRHPFLMQGRRGSAPTPLDESGLQKIFDIVKAETGADLGGYKPGTVGRRLLRRLMLHKLDRLEQYAALLKKDPKEVRAFYEDTLIHVTHFFREPQAFAAIEKRALPRLLKAGPADAPIRVWIPGCSTGEEAYSIAICLLDALGDKVGSRPLQVFATDVSDVAVARARSGIYAQAIRADVPARLLRRYFTKTERGYQISKTVRDACIFARQDLVSDPPFANIDLISCRNVLIYLAPAVQKRILSMFQYALKPSGALLLGAAESIGDLAPGFEQADRRARLYFKTGAGPSQPVRLPDRRPETREPAPKARPARGPAAGWLESDVQKAADRMLLARFAPAGVIVGADLQILSFRGEVSRYLLPASGKASLDLMHMLPGEWHVALHALVRRARKNDAAARQSVAFKRGGRRDELTIEVVPLKGPISGERCLAVLFEPNMSAKARAGAKAARAPEDGKASVRLRQELSATKEYLQSIIEDHEASNEELKAANEEIISSNEELQSTNEELETAKEELQAANEELTTLNDELQTRNADLNLLNNDLVNLLASVHLAIVMLDHSLRIRRFTPLAEKVLNLIPSDVGRPIGEIKLRLELPNLEQIIGEVVETVATREMEVRDRDGKWFSLRVRPYKTTENKIDGAVLVLIDIDAAKKAMIELKANTILAEAVFDLTHDGVVLLGRALEITAANQAFIDSCEAARTVVGRPLLEICGGRWDLPPLRAALRRLVDDAQPFSRLELDLGNRRAFAAGRRLAGAPEGEAFLLAIDLP